MTIEWDSQADWENYQEKSPYVTVLNGNVTLNPPPNSVTNHYPGNEGSGSTLTDIVGSANFTLNGPSWVSDTSYEGGYGLLFDGTDDYGTANLVESSTLTWIIRVKANPLGETSPYYRTVINHGIDPFITYSVNGNMWRFKWGGNCDVADAQADVESETRILVARSDGSTGTLDVYDGSHNLVNNGSFTGVGTTFDGSTTYLGSWDNQTRFWDGIMDPQFFWADSALTDSQVSDMLQNYY